MASAECSGTTVGGQPATNHGWLLKGGDSPKAFASRQHPSPLLHPRPRVTYTVPPPEAQEDISLPACALALLAAACAGALGKRRR